MLNKFAFANSLTLLMVAFYLLIGVLRFWAPPVFVYFFNAQFVGANVASLLPAFSWGSYLGTGAILLISTWVLVYLWALLYNRLARL